MEIKEAIEYLNDVRNGIHIPAPGIELPLLNDKEKEAVDLAIAALEKQEWHNARKDPPKRPDNMWDTYYVYTKFDRYGVARYYAHGKWDGYDEDGDRIEEYEIIAYCNFKPYTEEES